MRRALAALAVMLLMGDASGVLVALAEEACEQPCPGDASEQNCPPTCDDCACCSLPRVVMRALTLDLITMAPKDIPPGPAAAAPPMADPVAIFHVPKLGLA